jgi:fluoroacetyl-CoA thioesterase
MKETLKPGLRHTFTYVVPDNKTVPHIYRESPELQVMPPVFATGYMIALMEWTCVQLLTPHLDEGEGSLGVQVNVSHTAATPVGFPVTVDVELVEVDGRKAWFRVRAHDGADVIGEGEHGRFIVEWERFNRRVAEKAARFVGDMPGAPADHARVHEIPVEQFAEAAHN